MKIVYVHQNHNTLRNTLQRILQQYHAPCRMPSVTGTIPQDRYPAAAYIHEHRNTLQRTLQHTATHVNAPCCMPSVAGTTQQDQRNLTEEPDRGSGSLRNLRARPPGLESTLTTFAPCALNIPLVSTGLFCVWNVHFTYV